MLNQTSAAQRIFELSRSNCTSSLGRLTGSSSAYGDTPTLPKREDMPPNPLSPYALQKLVGEQYGQLFTRLYGFDAVTIRYFNVFGPRQDPEGPYAAVIPRWFDALLEGREVVIHGDGETSRDFCYVANVVQANLKAIGFDTKIVTLTSAAYSERGNSCTEALPSNGAVNYDPLSMYFNAKGTNNWSCLKDPKLQSLFDEAGAALDQGKRDQVIRQMQVYIMENAYEVPIVELAFYTTMQQNVQGIVYDATGFYPWLLDATVN